MTKPLIVNEIKNEGYLELASELNIQAILIILNILTTLKQSFGKKAGQVVN
jgi:hypothetical protein